MGRSRTFDEFYDMFVFCFTFNKTHKSNRVLKSQLSESIENHMLLPLIQWMIDVIATYVVTSKHNFLTSRFCSRPFFSAL